MEVTDVCPETWDPRLMMQLDSVSTKISHWMWPSNMEKLQKIIFIFLSVYSSQASLFKCVHVLQIREEIKQFGINIYQFPECDSDEDEDFMKQDQMLKVLQ